MYLLPLILSNTFWCLFVFSVSFLGRQPIRGLCLPPFRANYSAGSPSSVRETAGETAAALFGSYLPPVLVSPSSIFLGLGGDGVEGAGAGDYQRRLRERLLVLTLFVLPAVLPPFIPLCCRPVRAPRAAGQRELSARRPPRGQTGDGRKTGRGDGT